MRIFRKYSWKRVATTLTVLVILVGISAFIYVRFAYGATRTWDGGGTEGTCPGNANGWSCAQNWSSDTAPTSADTAAFDNTSDKDSTIDASFTGTVDGVDINTGYDGTITMERSLTIDNTTGFDQAAGTWNGGSQTFNIDDGGFVVSGGVHTATTGTWTIERSFTHSGGTLTMTGATVSFDDNNNADDSTLSCSAGTLGGTVTVSKDSSGDFTLSAGCIATFGAVSLTAGLAAAGTLTVNGTMTATDITIYGNITIGTNGKITLSGSLTAADSNSAHDTTVTCTGNFPVLINVTKTATGNGDFALAAGCNAAFGTFTSTTGNAGAASVTINGDATGGTMTVYGDLTVGSAGVLNFTTVDIGDFNSSNDTTLTCTGRISPAVAVNVVKDGTGNGDFALAAGCTVTFNTFTSTTGNAAPGSVTINGRALGTTMTAYGDLTVGSAGAIEFSGSIDIGDFNANNDTTLTCTGQLGTTVNVVKDGTGNGDFALAAGCTATFGTFTSTTGIAAPGSVTINGKATGTDITMYGDFAIGSAGSLNLSGTITAGGNNTNHDGTFTCNGKITNGNLTLNKTVSGATLVLGGSCTIPGNFTRTDGEFNNPASAYTLTINGNFSMSTTDTFGGANLTINMGGSSTQTLSQNAGTFSPPFTVNKTGGAVSLSTSFSPQSTCTVVEGYFDINGQTFACSSTFTIEDGGALRLIGSESPTTPTLNSGSTVSYKGASGTNSYTIKNWSYSNLEIAQAAGTNTFNLPADLTITGNVNIAAGTLDTASGSNFNLLIGGGWNNIGTFTPRSGTVTFNDNSKVSLITGNTTFNNLTSTTGNKRFVFGNGSTQTISGVLTLTGAHSQYISLTSRTSGTQWNIISNGTESLSYLEVKDSNACGGNTLVPTSSVNLGNNNCWTLPSSTGVNDLKINQGVRINQGTNIRGL